MTGVGTLINIALAFGWLSLFAVGGAAAAIPEIHRIAVDLNHWMTDTQFADAFAIAQLSPGPNVLIVSLVGYHVAGIAGGLVATLAMCVPTAAMAYTVSRLLNRAGDSPWPALVQAALVPLSIGLMAASGLVLAFAADGSIAAVVLTLAAAVLALFWLAGCINAWNFMDGSNGLLGSQCLWLGLALAVVFAQAALAGDAAAWPWAGVALVLAAACAGFLPFNAPRAAIFLGDVGSGALGLACGLLLLVALGLGAASPWCLLLLPSALLVDATMTLGWRMLAGRRWYTAHREHLYQWLIRAGLGHAPVALGYLLWNLAVVVPACVAIGRWPQWAPCIAGATLALAASLWWFGKNAVRRRARRRGSRA